MASEYSEIKKVIDQREKIRKIKKQEENTLIQESKKIMNLVKKGSFENTINTQTSNQALEEFKTAVNDMIRTTKNNFSIMINIPKYNPHKIKFQLAPCQNPVKTHTITIFLNHLILDTRFPPRDIYT